MIRHEDVLSIWMLFIRIQAGHDQRLIVPEGVLADLIKAGFILRELDEDGEAHVTMTDKGLMKSDLISLDLRVDLLTIENN